MGTPHTFLRLLALEYRLLVVGCLVGSLGSRVFEVVRREVGRCFFDSAPLVVRSALLPLVGTPLTC